MLRFGANNTVHCLLRALFSIFYIFITHYNQYKVAENR